MSLTTPLYTAAVPVVSGDAVNDTNFNTQVDPQKNWIESLDGLTRIAVSANHTITANTEVVVYVDASGGAITITLPACTGQYSSITVKKIDTTSNPVNIVRAGSDTVETLGAYALAPVTTTVTLNVPNQSIALSPNGTQWRIEASHFLNRTAFAARLTSNIVMSVTTAEITMTTEEFDRGGYYDAAGSRFTAPIAGVYQFSGQFRLSSISTTTRLYVYYYKNGSLFKFGGSNVIYLTAVTGDPIWPISTVLMDLAAGDYVELFYQLQAGTGTLVAGADSTYWSGMLVTL